MLKRLVPIIAAVVAALLTIGCSQVEDPVVANGGTDPEAPGGASGETETVPAAGSGLLNIEFEGKFYPGVFVFNSKDSKETLDIREGGSVVSTSQDHEGVTTTQNARWGRTYDGISITSPSEGGEPIVTYYKGLGQDDLFAKDSKKTYVRQAADESDGEDTPAEDDDAE